jgi:hypothetical protein
MKYSQKTKYFVFGFIGAVILIPLAIKAYDTIPLQFNTGDIVSANVFNNILGRVNNLANGFTSASDLVGTWSCTTYTPEPNCGTAGFSLVGTGLWKSKNQNVTFACSGGSCNWTAASFYPGSCAADYTVAFALQQNYDVMGNVLVSVSPTNNGNANLQTIQKLTPTSFTWRLTNNNSGAIVNCSLNNSSPAPANNLVASVSNSTISLTWNNPNSNQTGFKIQRTASSLNPWVTITTVAANATSYTDSVAFTGSYLYRVISTNTYGDSISSSEVSATVINVVSGGASGSGSGSGGM